MNKICHRMLSFLLAVILAGSVCSPGVSALSHDGDHVAADSGPGALGLDSGTVVSDSGAPQREEGLEGDSPEVMESDPNAASDPNPGKLNLATLVQEEGFSSLRSMMLLTSRLSGSTILVGEDNEDCLLYTSSPDCSGICSVLLYA